jgi:hypothetical protein
VHQFGRGLALRHQGEESSKFLRIRHLRSRRHGCRARAFRPRPHRRFLRLNTAELIRPEAFRIRIIRLLALTALSLGAAACEPDRGIIPTQVIGVWTDSRAVRQGVTWANTADLRPNGEFYWDQITYGGHPYGPDVPVSRTIQHGRYRTRAGVLDLRVESL